MTRRLSGLIAASFEPCDDQPPVLLAFKAGTG